MVALLGLTWGGTFLVTEVALEGITPFWLAAARISFAASLMVLIWGALGFRLFDGPVLRGTWLATVAIGALMVFAMAVFMGMPILALTVTEEMGAVRDGADGEHMEHGPPR